ncbi:hypothetical protein IMAU80053_01339 [Lactiplantibacillus plantarum]|nr:hypothetical protein S102022_02396 [Lactiplantibacillus plantarum]MCG0667495.1 hypothetical protein [Lactiplantibacillus plantarum]
MRNNVPKWEQDILNKNESITVKRLVQHLLRYLDAAFVNIYDINLES